jgi:hypothetical protein
VLKFGSGDLLCELADCGLLTVAELKWLVEAKTGLDPDITVLLHAEHGELKDGARLTDLVGLPTTELYAQTLMKVSVAQHLGIAPHEVTNDQFTTLCAALVSEPLAILELRGCTQVRDFSLLSLSLSKLDISDCNLFAEGGEALAAGLKGNQAITELNVSNNSLGIDSDHHVAISGIIAIADVIGDGSSAMGHFTFGDKQAVTMTTAMTEANFSGKLFPSEAQMVVAFLPKCTCVPSEYPLPISPAANILSYRQQGNDKF